MINMLTVAAMGARVWNLSSLVFMVVLVVAPIMLWGTVNTLFQGMKKDKGLVDEIQRNQQTQLMSLMMMVMRGGGAPHQAQKSQPAQPAQVDSKEYALYEDILSLNAANNKKKNSGLLKGFFSGIAVSMLLFVILLVVI